MASGNWQATNGASMSSDMPGSFTISAPPHTDIWRRSDEDDVMNAPMLYQTMKSSDFKKISVTVFAPWKTQYDQGGLIIAFPHKATTTEEGHLHGAKWIKAGIEYFSLESCLAVVGTDRYSDWSLSPMHTEYHQKARFEAVREGTSLWIYAAQEGSEKLQPMREIKWAFMEGRIDEDVWIGVYAAKPTAEEGGEEEAEKGIEVTFSDFNLERDE